MGLVNLKTNLKSLKYGSDRPGGGSSGQPYIVTPIPDGLTANGPDFLLRQGALRASLTDSERLFKFFSDPLSSRGLLFTTKQIALERQNPSIPGGLNRIYLPTNTLSQALLLPEGFHLNKQGLNPFELGYADGGTAGYFNYTLNKATQDNTGRLSVLYSSKIASSTDLGSLTPQEREFNISRDSNFSISYSGGPNSVMGLGRTNIKLAGNGSRSPRDRTNTYKLVSDLAQNLNQVYTFTNTEFAQQTPFIETKSTSLIGLTDYRATINTALGGDKILPETNYGTFNREDTYGTSFTVYNISYPRILNGNVNINKSVSSDVLNVTDPINANEAFTNDYFNKDLIKFFFEVIDPAASTDSSTFLFFRAYLNSIGDGFKADWQPYKYVGRAENFYKYTGFSRDVQLSFTIYAHSRDEMKPLYKKLNRLVGTTAPKYAGSGYMLGNFIKLTVGTYFNGVPGIINSITLKPSFEAGWDINRTILGDPIKEEDEEEYNVGQIPRMIEVDLTFTPIHDFTPQSDSDFINNTPVSKPPKTETPSDTPDTINEPIPSSASITGNISLQPGAIEVT
jgi:hypothetical protein